MSQCQVESEMGHGAAAALLGDPAAEMTRIGGGRNSRVYRVAASDGRHYALKLYFQSGKDGRDRRATEFTALQFLWRHGVRSIPEPLTSDAKLGASLFGFIDGTLASAGDTGERDIDQLTDFLIGLRALTTAPDAEKLPIASEAVFSLAYLVESIERRLRRLREVRSDSGTYAAFHAFLSWDLQPALSAAAAWGQQQLAQHGLGANTELDLVARTLSPSDFGFHNALRTPAGGLVFVDFEYFGWDDPAKMVSDFLLHPGMKVSPALRGRFLGRVLRGFGIGHAFDVRIRVAYALYALKWCCILLNEFVPEHLERRLFANPGLKREEVQGQQLEKARAMLKLAQDARCAFPYEEWMCP
jgi:hypothetical protein